MLLPRVSRMLVLLMLSAVTIVSLVWANDDSQENVWGLGFSSQGRDYRIPVSNEDLRSAPQWSWAETNHPPLGIVNACEIARKELHRYVTNHENAVVGRVSLIRYKTTSYWFYLVRFDFLDSNGQGFIFGDTFYIVVLMSGECVLPTTH